MNQNLVSLFASGAKIPGEASPYYLPLGRDTGLRSFNAVCCALS